MKRPQDAATADVRRAEGALLLAVRLAYGTNVSADQWGASATANAS